MRHKILTADYHRNGVGSAGFYVAIVETTDTGADSNRFLVTWFPEYSSEEDESIDFSAQTQMSVVNLDLARDGNIGMHPITDPGGIVQEGTGGNAWRGSDNWSHDGDLYRRIYEWVETGQHHNTQRMIAEHKAQQERGK